LLGNLVLNKTYFIKHVQQLRINSGSKQNIEHDYESIYDMFDLSRILRIRVLGIPGWSLMAALSTSTTINKRGGDDLKHTK